MTPSATFKCVSAATFQAEIGTFPETGLTDRLHLIHLIHEVSLPQVDGELMEEPHSHSDANPNRCDATGVNTHLSIGTRFLKDSAIEKHTEFEIM